MADQAIGSDQGPEAEEICSNCTTRAFTSRDRTIDYQHNETGLWKLPESILTRSIIGKKVEFSRPVLSKAGSKEKSWLSRAGRRVTGIYGKRAMALSRLL